MEEELKLSVACGQWRNLNLVTIGGEETFCHMLLGGERKQTEVVSDAGSWNVYAVVVSGGRGK